MMWVDVVSLFCSFGVGNVVFVLSCLGFCCCGGIVSFPLVLWVGSCLFGFNLHCFICFGSTWGYRFLRLLICIFEGVYLVDAWLRLA